MKNGGDGLIVVSGEANYCRHGNCELRSRMMIPDVSICTERATMAKANVLSIAIILLLAVCAPALGQVETQYFALYMQGKKVGYRICTRRGQGYQVTTSEDLSLTVSRIGIPLTVKTTLTHVETKAGRPLGFESVQLLGAKATKVSGKVNHSGLVVVTSSSLGARERSTMQWPAGALMSEGLRLLMLKNGLKTGSKYRAKLFVAGNLQAVEAKVSVGEKKDVDLLGRVLKLTEVTTTWTMPGASQISIVDYVDDDMKTLKTNRAFAGTKMDIVACAKEFAMGDNDVLEMIGMMSVDSPVSLDDLGSASAITYWIRPKPGAVLTVPTTDNQKATRLPDGAIKLVVKPVLAPPGGSMPYRGNNPALREAVEPALFLQSDHKEIVALARKAVGRNRNPARAVKRIESFVADYIENANLSVGYASAAEVAESRQGDCTEHAVLTAAMCRAVGIPAQVVSGVAYVQDFDGRKGFFAHAWTQAYVARKWVGLDASFKGSGWGGHDAGHIALAIGNGDLADFSKMSSDLGAFKIEKVQVEKRR